MQVKNNILVIILILFYLPIAIAQEKPNVILILADDLGVNALHCYGNNYVESPEIDKLYDSGVHFTNGYSNAPVCAPARACLMSGLSTPENKIFRVVDRYKKQKHTRFHMRYLPPDNDRPLGKGVGIDPALTLLPEVMKDNGYATAGFGKWHLGAKDLSMIHQGFDVAVEATKHNDFKTYPPMDDVKEGEYHADYITRKGIAFMENCVEEDKAFFLYMPYYLVHKPLEPKDHHYKYFREKYKKELDDETIRVLAMIKSLDESVGQLMTSLEDLGIAENTLVIFTSDNGHYKTESPIFTQPYKGFKGSTFEGGIRTPYIIHWPGVIKEKQSIQEPIILFDLFPTILDLTQSQFPERTKLDGVSFAGLLRNPNRPFPPRELIWMYSNYSGYNPKKDSWRSKWVNVIQSEGWKLTEDVNDARYSLYNLNVDPYETKELSDIHPRMLRKLKGKLENWKKENGYPDLRLNPDFRGE